MAPVPIEVDGDVPCVVEAPTAHGAAIGILDEHRKEYWVLEVEAGGSESHEYAIGIDPAAGCPLIQAKPGSGLIVVSAALSGPVNAYVLNRDEDARPLLPPITAERMNSSPLWFALADDGSFFMLMIKLEDGALRMARVTPDGELTWVPGDLASGDVVPSEPGTLFLHGHTLSADGTNEHSLLEITCNIPGVSLTTGSML